MLFNLDKRIKYSILQEYKKEALLHRQKKEQERLKKIKEEQQYLENEKKKEELSSQILKAQEILKKEKQMKEYKNLLLNFPNQKFDKKQLIIKNWGLSRNQSIPFLNQNSNSNKFIKHYKSNYTLDYNSLTPAQRERIYIRKSDNMHKYLTDEQNEDEINNLLKGEKKFRQKFYGELLNSQFEEAQKKNKDKYGTNDILIIKNKKKNRLYDNIFNYNKRYDFGKSNLIHNPILRPENDITYNKYINLRLNKNILKNINNIHKIELENKNYLNNIKINDNNRNDNMNLKRINFRNFRNKIYQSESDLFDKKSNNENNYNEKQNLRKNLKLNNYSSLSNDNIFNNKKILNIKNNINKIYETNPSRNIFETKNIYQNRNNNIFFHESNSNFYF